MKGFAEPVVTTEVFQVTMLPPSHVDYRLRLVEVVRWDHEAPEDRQWVVRGLLDACLGRDGTWDDEIKERGRGEAWLADHRFDLETAQRLAREACPDVVVGILSTRQVLERDGVIGAPGREAGREAEKVGPVASQPGVQGTACSR